MLNRYPVNLSGRALWVRSASALAMAAALAVAPAYGYQQFGAVQASASVEVTLAVGGRYAGSCNATARAQEAVVPTLLAAGAVQAEATTTGVALVYRYVAASATADGTAYGSALLGDEIGSVYCVPQLITVTYPGGGLNYPTGTLNGGAPRYETWIGGANAGAYATAIRSQFLTGTALAEATGDVAGDVTRYATLTDNLASIEYTRAETTLALATDPTVWRHEGFVPLADAAVSVTIDNLLTEIIATVGPYNLGQAYVPSAVGTLVQPGVVAAQGQANGVVAPTHTIKSTASGNAGATATVVGTRIVPTARAVATADAASYTLRPWIDYQAQTVSSGDATSGLAVGDHQQAGRVLGTATSDLILAQQGNQYYATSLDTALGTLTPPLANLNHAARVNVSGVASAVSVDAKWSHGYLATAAALTQNTGTADADVDYQATATGVRGDASGEASANVDYAATTINQAGAAGLLAVTATQHYTTTDAADGTATGSGAALMNYPGWVDQSALATGTALGFANSEIRAPDCRYLRVPDDPRTILVPADDRLLRVIC